MRVCGSMPCNLTDRLLSKRRPLTVAVAVVCVSLVAIAGLWIASLRFGHNGASTAKKAFRFAIVEASDPATALPGVFLSKGMMRSHLRDMANFHAINDSIFSVVLKPAHLIPRGASAHDYVSYAKYFWPDPANTSDSAPWIRIDGRVNPIVDLVTDFKYFRAMTEAVRVLSLGYYFLGDESLAAKACARITEWFIAPATRMTPHVMFAAMRINDPSGIGSPPGILDLRPLTRIFTSVTLLNSSRHYTLEMDDALKAWAGEYITWLDTSPNGQSEKVAPNNHAVYFDTQYVALLRFLGRTVEAREYAFTSGRNHIQRQINPNGTQPHELSRTLTWYYSCFNLQAFFSLSQEAASVGVNLYTYTAKRGQALKAAVDYLLPYAVARGKDWPYDNSASGFEVRDFLGVLQLGYLLWRDPAYVGPVQLLRERVEAEEGGYTKMELIDEWVCANTLDTSVAIYSCRLV